jgi:hydrogenase assembly chaperone HypC/HupF
MCLGIPMQVMEGGACVALCRSRSGERRVNLLLVGDVPVGSWVLVHMDNAVRQLDEDEVEPLENALEAIVLAARGENVDHLFADIIAARRNPA